MRRAERRRAAASCRRSQATGGFTLIEVLAAVAVLGLVYSMLATAAIQGLRAEGDATRRLRASLLADERITDIEAQVAAGQLPDVGESEQEIDDFLVRTAVSPLSVEIQETKASRRASERLERAVGARPDQPREGAGSFLEPSAASKQPLLRRIDLTVAWGDGDLAQTVRRTAFGLDRTAAAPLIDQLVAAADAEKKEREQAEATSRDQEASDSGTDRASAVEQPEPEVSPGADPADAEGDAE